ncbi:hypothetical protein GCM10010293_54670 [Streptomyces griseoflavus]|uniref:hypothetical protein n=2 Tax=Streptomyces griseoflavus TaxID=35619 RepID=UPI00167DEB7C|nr:hypothetical protein [Streptomyces griseoflavus]GGV46291.1 hypothetical protein GCM10010293_54670 [Streptomyces griseoflavus]
MKIGKTSLVRLASVLTGSLMLVLAATLPAQSASYFRAYLGSNYAGVGADREWVEVCDIERDGNGVYAAFYVKYGGYAGTVRDGNGSSGGCGNARFAGTIIGVELCEDQVTGPLCDYWPVPS